MSIGFISRTFFDSEPITDFPEDWKKRKNDEFEELKKKIKSKEYASFYGVGYTINYEMPHDCDCEYCNRTEYCRRQFTSKKEAFKQYDFLCKIDDYDVEYPIEGIFFFKVVKQEKGEMYE